MTPVELAPAFFSRPIAATLGVITLLMATYLSISLLTSLFMNWFNSRMALVER